MRFGGARFSVNYRAFSENSFWQHPIDFEQKAKGYLIFKDQIAPFVFIQFAKPGFAEISIERSKAYSICTIKIIKTLTYANAFKIGNTLIFDFSLTDTERIENTVNPIDNPYH